MWMLSMKITDSCFSCLPKRNPKPPRKRFVNYYEDLYAIYEDKISAETFLLGSQYSYSELGDSVLAECDKKNLLIDLDLMVIATWAQEFDADYSSCSAYFSDKYSVKGRVIDVCDQGSMIVFTALNLIHKFLQVQSNKRALLLFLEQSSIPINSTSQAVMPVYDAATAILLQREKTAKNLQYEVISAGILPANEEKYVANFIQSLCHLCSEKALTIITKNPLLIQFNKRCKVKTISNCPGAIPWLHFLHELIHGHEVMQYGLVLDQDVETNEIGYLIIRRNECLS